MTHNPPTEAEKAGYQIAHELAELRQDNVRLRSHARVQDRMIEELRAERDRLREVLEAAEDKCRDTDGPMSACTLCESIAPASGMQSHRDTCPFAALSPSPKEDE